MRMLLLKPWVAGFSGVQMGGEAGSDLTTQLFWPTTLLLALEGQRRSSEQTPVGVRWNSTLFWF